MGTILSRRKYPGIKAGHLCSVVPPCPQSWTINLLRGQSIMPEGLVDTYFGAVTQPHCVILTPPLAGAESHFPTT